MKITLTDRELEVLRAVIADWLYHSADRRLIRGLRTTLCRVQKKLRDKK